MTAHGAHLHLALLGPNLGQVEAEGEGGTFVAAEEVGHVFLHKPLGEQATQPVGQLLRVVTRFRCSRFLGFAVGFVVRTSTDRHFFVKASAQRKELF